MGIEVKLELTDELAELALAGMRDGGYSSVEEYLQDLLRRDGEWAEPYPPPENVEELKAKLRAAFAVPIEECIEIDAETFLARMRAEYE